MISGHTNILVYIYIYILDIQNVNPTNIIGIY